MKYSILVTRVSYAITEVTIEAKSKRQAKQLALKRAEHTRFRKQTTYLDVDAVRQEK